MFSLCAKRRELLSNSHLKTSIFRSVFHRRTHQGMQIVLKHGTALDGATALQSGKNVLTPRRTVIKNVTAEANVVTCSHNARTKITADKPVPLTLFILVSFPPIQTPEKPENGLFGYLISVRIHKHQRCFLRAKNTLEPRAVNEQSVL